MRSVWAVLERRNFSFADLSPSIGFQRDGDRPPAGVGL